MIPSKDERTPSLIQAFRLHYGEGKGKSFDKDFNFFRLGWESRENDITELQEKLKSH